MKSEFQDFDFPSQRVSAAEKASPKWYANCCDWVIAQGQAMRQTNDIETKFNILHGQIPEEYYKKILNPYNAKNDNYKRFPATMRNYDMIKGIIRRYVSEYIKNPHDFIVGANNPEVILARNAKLRQELAMVVEQQIAAKIQESYQQFINEGNDPQQFNPQEAINVEAFIQEFNENYIDDISAQGQSLLNVIKDLTDDTLFYARAYFDFIAFGEVYTYSDVVGNQLIKRNVSVRDAFPVPTDSMLVEDFDMFAERRKLTYQQIIDEFDDYLSETDRKFLDTYYAHSSANSGPTELAYSIYESYFPQVCEKFSQQDRDFLKKEPNMMRDINSNLYDVWHAVWRGEAKRAIVTYVNQAGLVTQRVEEEGYQLNKELGDIDVEYIYEPQVYESVRIGTRNTAIYPYGARAIAFNRKGKLPYNGVCELLPGFGKFSVIDTIIPYQVFYNIVAYHREMVIAKNKMSVLILAKSLLGKVPEETIYKMVADGVLYVDDTNDQGLQRTNAIRMVEASYRDYITQLSNLLTEIEQAGKNQVDMTPQRYGEIANSAGKGVTDEAINRGSMGTVIIEYVMDFVREHDYARDMDYTKLAWIDGIDTSYRDEGGIIKYISMDVDKHLYADYIIKAKNSAKEKEKLDQLKQFAFNLGQNGDAMMAIAAIKGDNVEAITKLIKKYSEQKQVHDDQLQQAEQQLEQMKQENEIQKIAAKGEEDRKTKELEGYLDQQLELIKADANMISFDNGVSESAKQAGAERLEAARGRVERDKLQVEKQKSILDAFSKERDRQVKEKDIDTKLKIAKENKNRYDSKSKK